MVCEFRIALATMLALTALQTPACSAPDRREEAGRCFVSGMQSARQGDYEKALRLLEKAQELDPSKPAHFYQAVVLRYQRGDLAGALVNANIALSLHPNHMELLDLRGDILRGLGRPQEAIEDYRRCISLNPVGYWSPWMKLGALQESLGAVSEARATYEDVLRLYPGLEEAKRKLKAIENR